MWLRLRVAAPLARLGRRWPAQHHHSAPQRRRLETGGNATLRVFASGAGPLAYQWQQEGTNVPGATNATLLVGSVGNYSVTVSNSLGGTVSPPAPWF